MNKEELHDLIYLVIDGESTENEKSILFGHLAQDVELQEEFQDAINFSRIINVEKKLLHLHLC
jgi:hypothetical protein